jgi:hypothetical protein
MLWPPTPKALVLKLAWPLLSGTLGCAALSIVKVIVPVGVPAPGATAATAALKVTDCPNTDGLTLEPKVITLLARFTVWLRLADALALKLASPL